MFFCGEVLSQTFSTTPNTCQFPLAFGIPISSMAFTSIIPASFNLRGAIFTAEGSRFTKIDIARIKPLQVMRTLNATAVNFLVRSMSERGFLDRYPLLVVQDSPNTFSVLRGNHRLEAAKQAKIQELPVQKLKLSLPRDTFPSHSLLSEISSIATSLELHAFPRSKISKVYELVGLLRTSELVDCTVTEIMAHFRRDIFREAEHWLYNMRERTYYRFTKWAKTVIDYEMVEAIGRIDSLALEMDRQIDIRTFDAWTQLSKEDAATVITDWAQLLESRPDADLKIPPRFAPTPVKSAHQSAYSVARTLREAESEAAAVTAHSAERARQPQRTTTASGAAATAATVAERQAPPEDQPRPAPVSEAPTGSRRNPYIDDMAQVRNDGEQSGEERSMDEIIPATNTSEDSVAAREAKNRWVQSMKEAMATFEKSIEENNYKEEYGKEALKEVFQKMKKSHKKMDSVMKKMDEYLRGGTQGSRAHSAKRLRTA